MAKWASFDELFVVGSPSECWLWTGSKTPDGYGRRGGSLAHRTAYERARGPIPDGMELDHLCRVRACVNPSHLEVVDHRTNHLRGMSPGAISLRRPTCLHGHPRSAKNVYLKPGTTNRQCRACNLEAVRRYKNRRRELVPA